MTGSVLSQDYFDELCLENAELFDLSKSDAVQESINQVLSSQSCLGASQQHSLVHLTLTFPTSEQGKRDRTKRKEMKNEVESIVEWIDSTKGKSNDLCAAQHLFTKLCGILQSLRQQLFTNSGSLPIVSDTKVSLIPYFVVALDGLQILALCLERLLIIGTERIHCDVSAASALSSNLQLLSDFLPRNLSARLYKQEREWLTRFQASLRPTLVQATLVFLNKAVTSLSLKQNCVTTSCADRATRHFYYLVTSTLNLVYWFSKYSDANKKMWMLQNSSTTQQFGLAKLLVDFLRYTIASFDGCTELMMLIQTLGQLIALLCTFDDYGALGSTSVQLPVTAATTHVNSQALTSAGAISQLHQLCVVLLADKEHWMTLPHHEPINSSSALVSVIIALRALATHDDSVETMLDLGVLDICRTIMIQVLSSFEEPSLRENDTIFDDLKIDHESEELNFSKNCSNKANTRHIVENPSSIQLTTVDSSVTESLATAALGFLRNLAANDHVKLSICYSNTSNNISKHGDLAELLLACVSRFPACAVLQEHGCGTLAAICLRQPGNAVHLVQNLHAHVIVVQAMQRHPRRWTLQRQGALAIRNMVSRSPELRTLVLEANAQIVLQQMAALAAAMPCTVNSACQDEAYAALRDLGVSVKMMHIESHENGKVIVQSGVQEFGQRNPNFRPIYD